MRSVFQLYTAGIGLPTVAKKLSISKSTVSLHLREIEREIGAAVVRWQEPPTPEVIRGTIHAENGDTVRLKRGTLKGWHSFRTTFCTLALSAGMPMELVQRLTGHKSLAVVLKHYFKPGREQFRAAMLKAMPTMFTASRTTPEGEVRKLVAGLNAENWRTTQTRLTKLLEKESSIA